MTSTDPAKRKPKTHPRNRRMGHPRKIQNPRPEKRRARYPKRGENQEHNPEWLCHKRKESNAEGAEFAQKTLRRRASFFGVWGRTGFDCRGGCGGRESSLDSRRGGVRAGDCRRGFGVWKEWSRRAGRRDRFPRRRDRIGERRWRRRNRVVSRRRVCRL